MSVVIGEGQCVACYKKLEKTKCKAIVISHWQSGGSAWHWFDLADWTN
jgi:hypothetical protein